MPSKILMMGDSWGDWRLLDKEDHHTTGMLKRFGYTVANCCEAGSSNITAIKRADHIATEEYDWVIWFHTEVLRDDHMYDSDQPFILREMARAVAREQYKEFEKFRKRYNLKAIVIGGQAPTFDFIQDYIKIQMLIPDWTSEILDNKLPFCHIGLLKEFEDILQKPNCLDTSKQKNALLDEVELRWSMCARRTDLFPDKVHPGEGPHIELSNRLHNFMAKY